jgi:hypothetical protein
LGGGVEEKEFDVCWKLICEYIQPFGRWRKKGWVRELTSACDEARDIVIVEAIDALQIPGKKH